MTFTVTTPNESNTVVIDEETNVEKTPAVVSQRPPSIFASPVAATPRNLDRTLQEVETPNNNNIRYNTPEEAFKTWKKQDGTEKTRTYDTAARHKRRLIDKMDKAVVVALNDCNKEQKSIMNG